MELLVPQKISIAEPVFAKLNDPRMGHLVGKLDADALQTSQ